MSVRSWLVKAVAQALGMNDPNFSAGGMQFWTPGQPIYSDKDYHTFVRDGYKRNPTVYACINKIAGAASGIDWKLYTDRTRKKTIDKHPLLDLWRKPNPSMPGTGSFIEQSFGFWHMAGNNYTWAFRPYPNKPPLALWNLRPDRMKAVAGTRGIENYVYAYDSNHPTIYELPEILHMKFPGYDDDVYGLSPIQVASYFSDQQNEAMGWNTALMQNAGRPASVFTSKGILIPEQRNQIREEIRKKYSGKRNAGRPLFLEADMTWQNMSLTPMELDFLKSFELSTRQICAIFDIAPELVGDAAGKTFANVDAARQALYLENTLPKLDRMADYYNGWLLPMFDLNSGEYFTYDRKDIEALAALYAAQEKAKRDIARADWQAGLMTWTEYRDIAGLDTIKGIKKGWDCVRIGMVLVSIDSLEDYADQSLTTPALPPAGLPEPLNVPGALPPGQQPPQLPAAGQTGNPPAPATTPAQPKQPPMTVKPAANPKNPTIAPKPGSAKKSLDADGIYQPDDIKQQLAAFKAKDWPYITWRNGKNPCPICTQNDGVTVKAGQPFPSGHLSIPGHPNCNCVIVKGEAPKSISIERLLEEKIAQMLGEIERRKAHERNYIEAKATADDSPLDGQTLQLRIMSLQETADGAQEGGDATIRELRTSGDVYRAFIGRYS